MAETKRLTVPEAEEILGKEYPVLNHGFVRLIDYSGGDQRIVQAARVSYGEGTKKVRQDRGLIRYLMRHQHTSPFEQVGFTFHAKMPIFVARQWVRHRTARLNEISGRYSIMKDEFYLPEETHVNLQSTDNKQGRSNEMLSPKETREVLEHMRNDQNNSYKSYKKMIDKGLARELARINLPLSLYTEWYWQMDLRNLFHFLKLRMDEHAQYEIRQYANTIANIVKKVTPLAWEAFEDYQLKSITLSGPEIDFIKKMMPKNLVSEEDIKLFTDKLSKTERIDFISKLKRMVD
ncbi:FAD-dependent thymidylate synthase [Candidatus Pacearchaeota archaeon]|nr:MAG: FAD-dependent thymidylate synthase [Candidatus Pacearchaeota archaeon]